MVVEGLLVELPGCADARGAAADRVVEGEEDAVEGDQEKDDLIEQRPLHELDGPLPARLGQRKLQMLEHCNIIQWPLPYLALELLSNMKSERLM